jgi:Superinfection immunity protein
MLWLLIIVVSLGVYFWPTAMAIDSKKKDKLSIFLLNLFLGWTFIGWVVALVWAAKKDRNIFVAFLCIAIKLPHQIGCV